MQSKTPIMDKDNVLCIGNCCVANGACKLPHRTEAVNADLQIHKTTVQNLPKLVTWEECYLMKLAVLSDQNKYSFCCSDPVAQTTETHILLVHIKSYVGYK